MSHAIIKSGGKQFVVEEGQTVRVPSLTADAGSSIELDALFNSNGDGKSTGKISATVVDHGRDQKVVVFKKKRRKGMRRTKGHRSTLTRVRITDIQV